MPTSPRRPSASDRAISRRRFLALGTAALGAAASGVTLAEESGAPEATAAAPPIPTRPFGRTGYRATLFGLGGEGMLDEDSNHDRAVEMVTRAVDLGVNYFDTACQYTASQDHLGEALEPYRERVWIASKTHARDRDFAWRQLENSLRRLRTDHLDLWQMHMIHRMEELDAIAAPDGALRAAEEAREQGLVRFIGVTGHYDPLPLRAAIERYPFDSVLMPLNAADPHEHGFTRQVLPLAVEKGIAVIAMKVFARDQLRDLCGFTARDCLYYAWSQPISTLVASIEEIEELEENVGLAREFEPLAPEQLAALEARTAEKQADLTFYRTWTGPAAVESGGWMDR